jgi:very-short-patch-repair endonuclease
MTKGLKGFQKGNRLWDNDKTRARGFQKGNNAGDGWKKCNQMKKNVPLTEEHKRKISISGKGRIVTKETRKKLSRALTGRKLSKETIERLRNVRNKFISNHPQFIELIKEKRAKQKRTLISSQEIKLQNFLNELNINFIPHPYIRIKHGYQCDILIPSKKCIIECFGVYWHNFPLSRPIDIMRSRELRDAGYKVLVFWDKEINEMQVEDLQNKLIQCKVIENG